MRKPLKVFLSGPISSRMETYKAEFADAARIVSEAGHLPLNPATLPIGMEQRDYMDSTITLELTYVLVEMDGKSMIEIDKINPTYKVNGNDVLSKVKQLT